MVHWVKPRRPTIRIQMKKNENQLQNYNPLSHYNLEIPTVQPPAHHSKFFPKDLDLGRASWAPRRCPWPSAEWTSWAADRPWKVLQQGSMPSTRPGAERIERIRKGNWGCTNCTNIYFPMQLQRKYKKMISPKGHAQGPDLIMGCLSREISWPTRDETLKEEISASKLVAESKVIPCDSQWLTSESEYCHVAGRESKIAGWCQEFQTEGTRGLLPTGIRR